MAFGRDESYGDFVGFFDFLVWPCLKPLLPDLFKSFSGSAASAVLLDAGERVCDASASGTVRSVESGYLLRR